MGVRPGYRQTDVGQLPEDWTVKALGDVVDFLDGKRRPVKDSDRAKMQGDVPYYGASGVVDYVNAYLFNEDLILLAEDGENILSRNCRLAFTISGKTWVNNHAHVLRPRPGMSLDFLVEFLESRDYARYNTGTAQPKLNKWTCVRIPVVCPPLLEQRIIAKALSEVDALLETLQESAVKKRNLKHAVAQQLLTGRTRLPGFAGEWKAKPLGAISFVSKGTQLRGSEASLYGRYAHLNGGMSPSGYTDTSNTSASTIAISEGGNSCGYVQFMTEAYWCGGHCYSVMPIGIDNHFLYHALKGQQSAIMGLRVGSGLPNIQKTALLGFELRYPEEKAEEVAIAEMLSDMDAEIATLEQRLVKTRALKQGMAQELLTGKTRLI
jgi:type I restriction enzyme, S subunit